jgi:hypothetical protein
MKTTLFVTALALLATPAFAEGEGNGEPFPLILPPIATTMTAGTVGSSQNPFPYYAARTSTKMTAGTIGSNQNPFPYSVAGTTRSYNPATATPDQTAAAAVAERTRVSTR